MSNKKRRYLDSFMTLLFITGIVIFMYPFVSDRINDYLDQQIIRKYQQQAQQQKTEELEKIQQEYLEKNRELAKSNSSPGSDPFAEEEPEKVTQSTIQKHTIGVLSIPKINVRLPIFDQTTFFFWKKVPLYWQKPLIQLGVKVLMPFFLVIVDYPKPNYLRI